MVVHNLKDVYKELVGYFILKCDYMSVERFNFPNKNILQNAINVILKDTGIDMETFVEKVCDDDREDYITEIVNKFIYNNEIFNRECKIYCGISKGNSKISVSRRTEFLIEITDSILYEKNVEKWMRKYKNNVVLKKEDECYIKYYLKLNKNLKQEILNKDSFDDWAFPNCVENLSLYSKSQCMLGPVGFCGVQIFVSDKKEYEYLKSIGVIFSEKNFSSTSNDDIKWLNEKELGFDNF